MKPQEYSEKKTEIAGWPAHITSYKLGERYYCKIDNVSPGAWIARAEGSTREEAIQRAIARATELLSKTRRLKIK
jgi:hypothetical protein